MNENEKPVQETEEETPEELEEELTEELDEAESDDEDDAVSEYNDAASEYAALEEQLSEANDKYLTTHSRSVILPSPPG